MVGSTWLMGVSRLDAPSLDATHRALVAIIMYSS